MMSPKQASEDRGSTQFRHTPLQIIHILGNFLRIWSVYSMYRYLTETEHRFCSLSSVVWSLQQSCFCSCRSLGRVDPL
ncbi:hypothetical protein NL676_038274 [Syzygium grande]|nr:hypothetical protein NL676_038274 [Syzygium grande]